MKKITYMSIGLSAAFLCFLLLTAAGTGVPGDGFGLTAFASGGYYYMEESSAGLSITDVLAALVISLVAAALPVISVKRKYSMQSEKESADSVNCAYRADSTLCLKSDAAGARLINKYVTQVPIPGNDNRVGGGMPHDGFGASVPHDSLGASSPLDLNNNMINAGHGTLTGHGMHGRPGGTHGGAGGGMHGGNGGRPGGGSMGGHGGFRR